MKLMNFRAGFLFLASLAGLLVSCGGGEPEVLRIRQFHLRDTDIADKEAQLVRGEQLYRLHGAVTLEERRSRVGHYYTAHWDAPEVASGNAKIIFEYQQATTASKVLTSVHKIPAGQSNGSVEFQIIGDAYQKGGSVLAWRARLVEGKRLLDVKQSYLWK